MSSSLPLYLQQSEDYSQFKDEDPDWVVDLARQGKGLRWIIFVQHNLDASTSAYGELQQIMEAAGVKETLHYRQTFMEMCRPNEVTRDIVPQLTCPVLDDAAALSLLVFIRRWSETVFAYRASECIDDKFESNLMIIDLSFDLPDGGAMRRVNGRIVR